MRVHSFNSALVAAIVSVRVAHAHMAMAVPAPFDGPAQNRRAPISAQFPFPCQLGSDASKYSSSTARTSMAPGKAQELSFDKGTDATATHGGGSCQVSITYDWPPPADPAKWKVIHSIIGGCPAMAKGNLAGTAKQCTTGTEKDCLRTFNFTIPDQMKGGKATLAWTWTSVVTTEFYMNCAPVDIQTSNTDDKFVNTLPALQVSNIDGSDLLGNCASQEGFTFDFKDPGASYTCGDPSDSTIGKGQGACPAGKGVCGGGGSGSQPGATGATNQGGVFAETNKQSGPAPAASTSTAKAPATPSGVPCTKEGEVICMAGGKWGLCDHGFAIPRDPAPGTDAITQCKGKATKRMAGNAVHARALVNSA